MAERIYDPRYDYDPDHVVFVEEDDAGQLALVSIDGEHSAAVKLDAAGVKALRLALTRWERRQ